MAQTMEISLSNKPFPFKCKLQSKYLFYSSIFKREEGRTFPYQVYSLCTASMYYYHSLNLIYDFCLTKHGVRRHFVVEFGLESSESWEFSLANRF